MILFSIRGRGDICHGHECTQIVFHDHCLQCTRRVNERCCAGVSLAHDDEQQLSPTDLKTNLLLEWLSDLLDDTTCPRQPSKAGTTAWGLFGYLSKVALHGYIVCLVICLPTYQPSVFSSKAIVGLKTSPKQTPVCHAPLDGWCWRLHVVMGK